MLRSEARLTDVLSLRSWLGGGGGVEAENEEERLWVVGDMATYQVHVLTSRKVSSKHTWARGG